MVFGQGNIKAMTENYRKAAHLSRDPQLLALIQSLQAQPLMAAQRERPS